MPALAIQIADIHAKGFCQIAVLASLALIPLVKFEGHLYLIRCHLIPFVLGGQLLHWPNCTSIIGIVKVNVCTIHGFPELSIPSTQHHRSPT